MGCVSTLATVKHATSATLDALSPLLKRVRAFDGLVEKSPGIFYRKSKPFLHFHDDPAGIFADVRLSPDEAFTRFQVDSVEMRSTFLSHIEAALSR
jgi:hypothetical protein